jgi:hypothetical protein
MRTAIVTLATLDYFEGAKKLFESLKREKSARDVDLILFSNDPEALVFFGNLFNQVVSFPFIPNEIKSSVTVPRFKVTLYKMFALRFLEDSDYDRLIFLDSDLMIQSSIDFLLKEELNEFQFLAARDLACMSYFGDSIDKIGLDPAKIFNTGCFILNRSILDILSYDKLIAEVSNSENSYDGSDQGYFNYVVQKFKISLGELPIHFNYPLDINYPLVVRPPAFVHFTGEKPWLSSKKVAFWDKSIYRQYNKVRPLDGFGNLNAILSNIRSFFRWNLRNIGVLVYKTVRITYKAIKLGGSS